MKEATTAALKLALDALEDKNSLVKMKTARDILRKALEEALAQPKRPWGKSWVSLTDEETDALRSKTPPSAGIDFDLRCRDFARAIEAKLKELNT